MGLGHNATGTHKAHGTCTCTCVMGKRCPSLYPCQLTGALQVCLMATVNRKLTMRTLKHYVTLFHWSIQKLIIYMTGWVVPLKLSHPRRVDLGWRHICPYTSFIITSCERLPALLLFDAYGNNGNCSWWAVCPVGRRQPTYEYLMEGIVWSVFLMWISLLL